MKKINLKEFLEEMVEYDQFCIISDADKEIWFIWDSLFDGEAINILNNHEDELEHYIVYTIVARPEREEGTLDIIVSRMDDEEYYLWKYGE